MIGSSTSFGVLTTTNAFSPVSLNGTLEITLANSFIPSVGQRFAILSGPISGTFANIEGQTFNNGTEMWDVVYTPSEVDLVAVPTPEPSTWLLVATGMAALISFRSRISRMIQRKKC